MKLPLETQTATVVAGVILTAVFALLVNVVPGGMSGGVGVVNFLVLLLWLGMFGLLRKPS